MTARERDREKTESASLRDGEMVKDRDDHTEVSARAQAMFALSPHMIGNYKGSQTSCLERPDEVGLTNVG